MWPPKKLIFYFTLWREKIGVVTFYLVPMLLRGNEIFSPFGLTDRLNADCLRMILGVNFHIFIGKIACPNRRGGCAEAEFYC